MVVTLSFNQFRTEGNAGCDDDVAVLDNGHVLTITRLSGSARRQR